jgi:hypothetical protein
LNVDAAFGGKYFRAAQQDRTGGNFDMFETRTGDVESVRGFSFVHCTATAHSPRLGTRIAASFMHDCRKIVALTTK